MPRERFNPGHPRDITSITTPTTLRAWHEEGLGNDDIPTKGGRSKKKKRIHGHRRRVFTLFYISRYAWHRFGAHLGIHEHYWAASESDDGRSAACVLLTIFFSISGLALCAAPVSKSELLEPVLLCTSA